MKAILDRRWRLQVVKGLRGGVQDVALKMLIGETHYHINSFRQVQFKAPLVILLLCAPAAQLSKTHSYKCTSQMLYGLHVKQLVNLNLHIRVMDLS